MSTFRYEVRCMRQDGSERVYQTYGDLQRAHAVCARLRRVGCLVRVVDMASGGASYDAAAPARVGSR